MWPIIKKELRENAPYLLGAFVIVLLILDSVAFESGWILLGVRVLLDSRPDLLANASRVGAALSAINESWVLLCLVLAGAIALGQVYQERWRKTWPLLVHLPIPRSRMIFAKVLAGLLMYLIVLLPVALLLIARLYTPGVWPGPIHPYMFFPLLGFFLAGAMFYLAVFLSAFRPARWYATKWLPVFSAIPVWFATASFLSSLYLPGYWYDPNFMHTRRFFLAALATTVLSLAFVFWAIREQARTREY